MNLLVQRIDPGLNRYEVVERLRQLLSGSEGRQSEAVLPFLLPAIDDHLPRGGLAAGVLHEFTAVAGNDMPSAFGFVAALVGRALAERVGPGLLVVSHRGLADFGRPYGHGLSDLDIDPERLILVEAATDQQALWAVEEALRLRAAAVVSGWIGTRIDLKASRRLHLAAEGSETLLFLLRPPGANETNAAATRWRLASAAAMRDPYGCFARWRWQIGLERCRNGHPNDWTVEWDHAAHRFSLAGALADQAPSHRPEPESRLRRAG